MLDLEEMVGWAWSNLLTSTALPMSTESVTVAVHKFGTVETSILPILLLMAMMLTRSVTQECCQGVEGDPGQPGDFGERGNPGLAGHQGQDGEEGQNGQDA